MLRSPDHAGASADAYDACPDDTELADFIAGALTVARRRAVFAHIDACADCRVLLASAIRVGREDGPGATHAGRSGPARLEAPDEERTVDDGGAGSPSRTGEDIAHGRDIEHIGTGHRLGRYVLLDQLGAGAMGRVFRAFDPDLTREVAIKLLRIGVGDTTGSANDRLLREAQAAARLEHPNVVTIYEAGVADGVAYISMELVRGQSLREWLAESEHRPRPWREVLAMFVRAGEGLWAAHEAGLLHRDFKPDNVLVATDGRPRVTDFGLARLADANSDPSLRRFSSVHDLRSGARTLETRLTVTGSVMGTPAYMAPEQHRTANVDARADLYAFCVALYEGLYGQRPFRAKNMVELAKAKHRPLESLPRRDRHGVPRWLHEVVVAGLRADPDQRPADMRTLLAALRADPTPRRRRFAAAGMLALIAGGLVGNAAWTEARQTAACDAEGAAVEGIWNPEVADAIGHAFERQGAPHASAAWIRARPLLDEYARTWKIGRAQICKASSIEGAVSNDVLDRARSCFDDAARTFDHTVRLLASAETPDLERNNRVVIAAHELPDLSACTDERRLLIRPNRESGIDDPLVREQLEDELARAEVEHDFGRFEHAASMADEVAEASQGPLRARASMVAAQAHHLAGDPELARQRFEAAYQNAETVGDDLLAARAASHLVFVNGKDLADAKLADHWFGVVTSKHARLQLPESDHDVLVAKLNRSSALIRAGELEAAEKMAKEAAEGARRTYGERHLFTARMMTNYAVAVGRLGERERGLELTREALEMKRAALGDMHPDVAGSMINVGIDLIHLDRYEEAREIVEQAVVIVEATLGTEHKQMAMALHALGISSLVAGDIEEARRQFQRVVDIYLALGGPEHPDVAIARNSLGDVLHAQEDHAGALAEYEDAVAILAKAHGDDHPHIGSILEGVGRELRELERFEPAADAFERSFEITAKARGETTVSAVRALNNAAESRTKAGQPRRAVVLGERALALTIERGDSPANIARAHYVLASALWNTGDPVSRKRSREEATMGLELLEAADDEHQNPRLQAAIETWLDEHSV